MDEYEEYLRDKSYFLSLNLKSLPSETKSRLYKGFTRAIGDCHFAEFVEIFLELQKDNSVDLREFFDYIRDLLKKLSRRTLFLSEISEMVKFTWQRNSTVIRRSKKWLSSEAAVT